MAEGTRFQFLQELRPPGEFQTAVSLHSHTSSSRELLDFIPRVCRAVPLLGHMEAAYRRRYERENGFPLDYAQAWWTPPLSPLEAIHLESSQIQRMGLQPLVSITDHDTIDGVWSLRSCEATRDTIVGVEWTVPFAGSFFHLGIHNLPPGSAKQYMADFAAFTADPKEASLKELLVHLHREPGTLVVFNHPMWDEKGIGAARHFGYVQQFLDRFQPFLHALELNGLRPWKENRSVIRLGLESGMPLISGGDRHGLEPNANLNLTNAATFDEFVDEIRTRRSSNVVFLPQYQHSITIRVFETMCDVLRTNPSHALGWSRWTDRVFRRDRTGAIRPLSEDWDGSTTPALVQAFVSAVRLADCRGVRSAMRAAFGPREELAW